ncbi:dCTP deaminase [Candidatus Micrarchaeota archaeon]|nr:dCTP deaminase [Candidatus Micrarchaeota archaeon]MBD3418254.1 dCTP deaminase [Candidatus Micrarchaeota archaeon]
MFFSDVDIKKAIKRGEIKITPLKMDQVGQGSVDLSLGGTFWFFKQKYIGARVDLGNVDFKEATKKVNADTVVLAPGEMCLAISREKITLAPDIIGRLEGRSRYARMGLAVHITSAVVQPGSANHQVFEIFNSAPFTVVLHEGMRISQVVFARTETPTSKPYAKHGKIAKNQ